MFHLIELTGGNFLSFKDKMTLSMEATGIREYPDNVYDIGSTKLLKSAVIYGANSSGKSNLIKAMAFMKDTVMNSSKMNSTDKFNTTPFLLNTESREEASYFELVFFRLGAYYRYGFILDNERVHAEWFYIIPKGEKKEKQLFVREEDKIAITADFPEGKGLEDKTRGNGLFLVVCDQFNGFISNDVIKGISDIDILSGIDHDDFDSMTSVYFDSELDRIKEFYRLLNLGFRDIQLAEGDEEYRTKAITTHSVFDSTGNVVQEELFKLTESESSGTNKIFDLSGFILFALEFGLTVVIDELDAKLHPLLTKSIIQMFHSPETNQKNAQLIFATHDTNLLGCDCFRRDQIWFTEKNAQEQTDLYSLVEFKVRNDRNYEKDYIAGRYGAIPFIGDFTNLMQEDGQESED